MTAYQLSVEKIPLFKFIPKAVLDQLVSLGKYRKLELNEVLLIQGKPVSGLFLILEGAVGVYTKGFEENLAILRNGSTIGEMSLVDGLGIASASVRAEKVGTVVIEFPIQVIEKVILEDHFISQCFFKGVALLLSHRLRSTNRVVKIRVTEIRDTVVEMIEENNLLKKVANTRKSLEDLGNTVIDRISSILPELERLEEVESYEDRKQIIESLAADLKKITLGDLQMVDRISQKIDMIMQFLENIEKAVSHQAFSDIKGDTNLFAS